jgi:predicted ester cyclase
LSDPRYRRCRVIRWPTDWSLTTQRPWRHKATRVAYESYFTAFPDIDSDDQGFAAGDDVLVGWGVLSGTSGGEWLGLAPTGGHFAVRFTNVATFRDGRMAGESLYFDLATLCQQAGFSVDAVRAAAKARAALMP